MAISKKDLTEQQQTLWLELEKYIDPADPRKVFSLNGYAGTGKTSVVALFALEHAMRMCAFTGKAASVLTDKMKALGSDQKATTIHGLKWKLVDSSRDKKTGKKELVFESVFRNLKGQVVGVDEVSMLNTMMARDLITTDAKVIAIGDDFQLPPVTGERFAKTHDFVLKQVHRQALEASAVLRQLCNIRETGRYEADGPDFQVVSKLRDEHLLDADVVLCFRNATRHRINQRIRKMQNRPLDVVQAGETVMALKNSHRYGIFNGATYTVARDYIMHDDDNIVLELDDGVIEVPRVEFVPPNGSLDDFDDDQLTTIFDFGYCLTVHKSQGSEWNKVALVDEYHRPEYPRNWRYTGLSRAAKSIVVAR